jgi:glycosyltransferase involved in cell wall biosynthesis
LPLVQPCDRIFGAACLALFYPRRCGGLNPITMAREYRQQSSRFDLLGRYAAVMTHSGHMRREFIRHGAAGGRVHHAPVMRSETETLATPSRPLRSREANEPWRLVFVGRMDRLKGGDYLLDALPRTRETLGLPLRVTFAGDGPDRTRWERRAAEITASMPGVSVEFTGWLQPPDVRALFDAADLLIVPSLWPEPYGLVGPEAARRGVPSVAFATGGIPEWLTDGVNGCLAPGDRPSADGLADALIRCLRSLGSSDALRHGALASVKDEEDNRHVDALLQILNDAASGRVQAAPGTAS